MAELTDAQKVNREATQKRIAAALEEIAERQPRPNGLPAGGVAGQIPVKQSGTDYDTAWEYPRYPRRNLLDNWYFVGGGSKIGDGVFPINQRGQTSYGNGSEGVDRWIANNANCKLTVDTNFCTFYADGANAYWNQQMPGYQSFLGKTVTYSALIDGVLYAATGTFPAELPASGYTAVCTLDIPGTNLFMFFVGSTGDVMARIGVSNGTTLNIQAIKLEIGSYQTLAHQENGVWVLNELPDFGEELAKCQRYYFPIPSALRFNATYRSTSNLDFSFSIPVRMLGTMALTAPNIRLLASTGTGGAFVEQTGFTFSILANATGEGFATIRANKSSHGLLAATAIVLQPYTGAYLSTE